ncbi:MAG: hypothetical protein K6G23_10200 [Lachnospiraceae bacterium]|nr:hypothetical protein [Lachnospiraceae bacterium]
MTTARNRQELFDPFVQIDHEGNERIIREYGREIGRVITKASRGMEEGEAEGAWPVFYRRCS